MVKDICIAVLAGGRSSRMGRDKGLMPFRGMPLIQHVLMAAQQLTSDIIISTGNASYAQFGMPLIKDIVPDKGPAGGIYSALHHSGREYLIVLPCDMPFITAEMIKRIAGGIDMRTEALVVRYEGKLYPLCAAYHKSLEQIFCNFVRKDVLKMRDIINNINADYLDVEAIELQGKEKIFANFNSPGEMAAYMNKKQQ